MSDGDGLFWGIVLIVCTYSWWFPFVTGTEALNYEGADGHAIKLENNKNAVDPTYEQAVSFILNDATDSIAYTSEFQCGDFAEFVHNNAEAAGYKCGWVAVQFENDSTEHACVVFNTTNDGLRYFDCTSGDTKVRVTVGESYHPHIIPREVAGCGLIEPNIKYTSLGIVKSYHIYW